MRISIWRREKKGCGDRIQIVSFLLGASQICFQPSSLRNPRIFSLVWWFFFSFFIADHSGARVTPIFGRYSTINFASALTRIYRVSCSSVQRAEAISTPFTRRLFLFHGGEEPFLFWLYVLFRNLFLPLVARNPVSTFPRRTCSQSRKIYPRATSSSGIISRIKAAAATRSCIKRHRGQRCGILRANCI